MRMRAPDRLARLLPLSVQGTQVFPPAPTPLFLSFVEDPEREEG